jgi:tyrosyl-tRNA synthetase
MLLQAFDFMVLAREQNCELQIGGSDQWGNITAGIELTRKKIGRQVFGLTLPLITNADGTKFGKTVTGAVWLDKYKTKEYKFYQFWFNTDDRDVIRYLKYFTFLSREEIDLLEKKHAENPGARAAQIALAEAVTDLIHGASATAKARNAGEILFCNNYDDISKNDFEEVAGDVPTRIIERIKLEGAGTPLVELLIYAGLCSSKGEARKRIEEGGIYANNVRESNAMRVIGQSDLLYGEFLLLRRGKKTHVLLMLK